MSPPPAGPLRRRTAPLGEHAGLVFTGGHEEAQQLARALRARELPAVEDVVPASDSVGILVDPEAGDVADLLDLAAGLEGSARREPPRRLELPVCFDGQDLEAVAGHAGLRPDGLVALLASTTLEVGWLGFMPGFPYLVGLPAALASLPRLDRPRARVPAGAFALAGGYAGIYPQATPGGWHVIGRTALSLFDPDRPEPATFAPGDLVRVRAAGGETVERAGPAARSPITTTAGRRVAVLDPGTRTLVQDRGRIGVAHLGVPRAGPADPLRHLIANLAVGNAESAATLEVALSGPRLRFACDAYVALVGHSTLSVGGRALPPSSVQFVERGQVVSIGPVLHGVHAYLAVSGGIDLRPVLGSRSADTASGLWPGPLRAGDELGLGVAGRPRGRFLEPPVAPRVLAAYAGPDAGGGPSPLGALFGRDFEVTAASDRVGTRLRARAGDAPPAAGVLAAPPPAVAAASRAMVTGAVQLPPDGCPIVLGPDHGTVGGYPVVAVLSPSSLAALLQLRPGEVVRFEEAPRGREASLASRARGAVSGWMPAGLGGA